MADIATYRLNLLRVAMPLWREGRLDEHGVQTAIECAMMVLIIAVIPWDHVLRVYVRGAGERWRSAARRP